MNWTKENFTVSTDKSRLDIDVIQGFLRTSYWGASRTRNEIEKAIKNSVCFGLYHLDRQIGFARLVTDEVVISWLGDVFVIPEFQKKGLGKWMMACIVSHPLLQTTKCLLGTRDAHGLYEKFGWERKEGMSRSKEFETNSNQPPDTNPRCADS
ncbi:GNAT family N-acetyltransferase [Puniceicoccus vermicola]|uniref:GNAT family N-acetyltransferase n=1 Tax=Puniceicoccus vermicola TaxID=388746 RepID=A0A7X1B3N8_9BACT|nr:GNAT family N-acetyltransferase [Puniceicoccus vermicola]